MPRSLPLSSEMISWLFLFFTVGSLSPVTTGAASLSIEAMALPRNDVVESFDGCLETVPRF